MQDLLPARPLSDRNRPAWRTCVSPFNARRSFLVRFFIDFFRVNRGIKKKNRRPRAEQPVYGKRGRIDLLGRRVRFASGNVTRTINAKA